MRARDEIKKARDRGIDLTPEEVELETAREAWLKDRADHAARQRFKNARTVVAQARMAARLERQEAGPPDGVDVVRDGRGIVIGWHSPDGDAVAAPAGMAG